MRLPFQRALEKLRDVVTIKMDGWVYGWVCWYMNGWEGRWMDGRVDEWMGE